MNKSILEDEVEHARQVSKLKNQYLDTFFKEKEQQIFDYFKQIPLGDKDQLVTVHHQLMSLNALQVELQTAMDTGKMAQISLDAAKE